METDFKFKSLPRKYWVRGMINQMHYKYFKEVKAHHRLNYNKFKNKMLEMFKRPDMATPILRE